MFCIIGALGPLSSILLKTEPSQAKPKGSSSMFSGTEEVQCLEGFYEELPLVKEVPIHNSVSVSVRNCPDTAKTLLYLETDLPGDVVVHWGVCRDGSKTWEIPAAPQPPETKVFKNKALRTLLQVYYLMQTIDLTEILNVTEVWNWTLFQPKQQGNGSCRLFTVEKGFSGFLFVLKLKEDSWLNCRGNDFYIPLPCSATPANQGQATSEGAEMMTENHTEVTSTVYTDEIIKEIRNLVSDISSEKSRSAKTKEAQESILQEIEKLAAEAYSIFRSATPTFSDETTAPEEARPSNISSGTGTGYEILCQGFNWESHKSGRWYMELGERASELSALGFTIIWLPPPTDSVSPEGYMPRDLYNLNSRYYLP